MEDLCLGGDSMPEARSPKTGGETSSCFTVGVMGKAGLMAASLKMMEHSCRDWATQSRA